jgi:N-acetylglucosamine kinase-like BadF-type ATPase
MKLDDLVLGIDGGGTKTVAWLSKINGGGPDPIGSGVAGPSNPGVVGKSQAITTLGEAIDAAFEDAGLAVGLIPAACLAISGTERTSHRDAMLQWAADRSLATTVRLVGDAEAVLAGGSRDGWGVALIAGTGSFAFGRDLDGLTVRVGGWGYLFGDEGSGHALGAAGLQAATKHADGRGPATTLLPRLMSKFELTDPRELVTIFYDQQPPRRAALAELAPLVTSAAKDGDDVARQIASEAAADLAGLVIATCRQLNLSSRSYPLAIAGGVLCHSPLMRECLKASLAEQEHFAAEITLVEQPVQGAVELARGAIA